MIRYFILFFLLLTTQVFGQLSAAKYSIKNIKENTKYSDYGTAYFGPNRVIFASSKIDANKLRNKFNNGDDDNTPRYDLFKGFVYQNGEINYTKKVMNKFITKYNESNVSFTPDLRFVYFTQNNVKKGKYIQDESDWVNLKIYRATVKTNGEWTNVVSLPFNADNFSCAHPSVSEDGRVLFFASDMPGSKGKSDIYWVTILENGEYGEPQNIGSHVNSIARENFPYVDKNILYFSSDRKESRGGLDVFMVALDDPYAKPVNLGTAINSSFDDFCFVIDRQNKKGFFSSNRPEGKGGDDIYFFKQETEIKQCKQIISGKILDKITNQPIQDAIVTLFSHDSIQLGTYPVKSDGIFSFDITCRDNYRLEATKTRYTNTFRHIGFTQDVFTQEVILYLDKKFEKEEPKRIVVEIKPKKENSEKQDTINKIEVDNSEEIETIAFIYKDGKEMLDLPPIYFDLNQHYLTKSAQNILDKAVNILHRYPNIYIEFGAHTDCRASASYNLHLSQLRAQTVTEYIRNNGVDDYRIKGRGYGESRLVNQCSDGVKCSEEEHLQNRRTEFVILKK